MFTYKHYIAITCEDQLKEYTPEQKKILLDYCDEYIKQYRQDNPAKSLPHLKYFMLMAVGRFDNKGPSVP